MKWRNIVLVTALVAAATAIPWKAQLSLVNALEVGRDEDPNTWGCVGCEAANQPLHTYIIEEKAKDVKASLAVYEQYTILAFRYTATIKNVFQDILWAFQTQDESAPKGAKVQREFDKMWNTIRSDVLNGLRKTVHTGRLIITGISLGGALSCLSYVDIAESGIFENVQVITFGAPRVGNRNWAAWFDSITPSQRYYIKGDPIAALPRCLTLICNYKQTGTPIVCNKKTETCQVKGSSEDEISTSEVVQTLLTAATEHYAEEDGNVDGIIDHITGYKKIRDYTLIE